jgi:hypothetical protein
LLSKYRKKAGNTIAEMMLRCGERLWQASKRRYTGQKGFGKLRKSDAQLQDDFGKVFTMLGLQLIRYSLTSTVS